jgi:superfamily II DNA helicase RecQ
VGIPHPARSDRAVELVALFELSDASDTVPQVTDRPLELLHAIAGPDATFRAGQREAIEAVVAERRRVLLRPGTTPAAVASALIR